MKPRIDALLGAIGGDIIGSPYEFKGVDEENFKVFDKHCRFTDDSVLTIALADWLSTPGSQLQDFLIRYARKYYWAGYGPAFARWCQSENPQPYNSCGNGSAMRVSAVGCAANSVEEAMELARESAMPTHNHPEGIKGAQAIAVAIVLARQGKTKEEIKAKLQELFDYDLSRTYDQLYQAEYKFNVICQTTVPEALISFFESDSYEDCICRAVLTNKDCDTAAAVAGAVAGAYYGVPEKIKEEMYTYIPDEFKDVIDKFETFLSRKEKKTIVYLHGYGSSSMSGTVEYLKKKMPDYNVIAPDIPVDPKDALPYLRQYCKENNATVIIGTSMGGMYAMQMTDYQRICVNPALRMSSLTEVLKIGTFNYFQPTSDGKTQFTITQETIEHFKEMEQHMYDNINGQTAANCWGFFADEDELVNFRDEFEKHFTKIREFHGKHRMNNAVLRDTLIPFVKELLSNIETEK